MTDTNKLLLDYAHRGSESAFRELVTCYVDLVYSVALRRTSGNAHLAEDVTQSVFTDLARKARALPSDVMLGGWLHRHTCFTASNLLRAEVRRQNREREAVQMNTLHAAPDNAWVQLGPVLDEAIDQLESADREAIVLRYFEQQDLRTVGAAFGIGEDAAQKRVSRAVDKLRELVTQKGATLSATVLTAALASGAISAAPVGLARKVSGVALAAAGAGLGMVGGLLALAAATKIKLAVAAVVIVAAIAVPWLLQKRENQEQNSAAILALVNQSPDGILGSTNAASETPTNVSANATTAAKPKESGLLRLKIITADSGQPIPNVSLDYRRWDGDKFTGRKLQSTRMGDCEVSFPREAATQLELTTRVDGFADTRLRWRKDRGDDVPEEYTLQLDRAVPIGGTVVDADGNPVAGAKVGFNHDEDPTSVKWPQDHEFSWIEVVTDETGRWRINRMADELIRRIRGGARHSEYVDSAYLSLARDRAAEEKLRAEKFVFQLGRPVTVSGVVVDAEGAPVADAEVFVGGRSNSGKRTAKTATDGSFTVAGCRPGKELVSADAKGFATTTLEVAEVGSAPLRLVLQRGQLLRLRIMNPQGQPIPKANVWLDTFRNGPINQPRPIPVQANFSPRSDKEGLVIWSNAPDTELQFAISAGGYMRTNEFTVRPDGEEHVVVLLPAVMISGRVTDVGTGKPIPRFRIISGWPKMNIDGTQGVNWSSFERDWLNFTGGKYLHKFEDALIHGTANPGYALKFEADGYASFVTRVIKADEGEIQLDVALTPAATRRITVLLPDGRVAANAEVGLISPGVRLELMPGRFNRDGVSSGGSLLLADKEGRFSMPPDDDIHTVMVVHPSGFAQFSRTALANQEFIQLQPWGRLEGTVSSGGTPAVGREFSLEFAEINSGDLWFGYTAYRAKSDEAGKFVFPLVPPGKLKLLRIIPVKNGWSNKPEKDVEIRPGETTQVAIGGEGYTVTARVRWPAGFDQNSLQHLMAAVCTPTPAHLIELAKDPARRDRLQEMPEVQAFKNIRKEFQMEYSGDGAVSAEEVTPGEYMLSIYAFLRDSESKTNMTGLVGEVRITVPANPSHGKIDVGEVALNAPPENPR
jgi:RNA polymerase sigma factor (sigma-70 family)